MVPPVLWAIVLLGGPTAGWLLYKFVVQPRTARMRGSDRSAMWVCHSCRSVNDLRMPRCYRCDAAPDEEALEVIDSRPTGPIPLSPVGPGLDLGRIADLPAAADLPDRASRRGVGRGRGVARRGRPARRAALPEVAAMTEVGQASNGRWSARPPGLIPVGPGRPAVARPAVARPRRAVVAGPRTGS